VLVKGTLRWGPIALTEIKMSSATVWNRLYDLCLQTTKLRVAAKRYTQRHALWI